MAAIIKEPLQSIIAAYEPIEYRVLLGEEAANISPVIEVEVIVNGEKYGKSIYPTPATALRSDSTVAYTFVFNISERIQTYFDNFAFFHRDRFPTNESEDWQCNFQIYVYDWKQNEDGVLERSESFSQSQNLIAVNATEQILSESVVEDFTFFRALAEIPFFTYKPNNVAVALKDSEFLHVWSYFVSHIKFESYDRDSVLIQTAYLLINNNAGEQKLLGFGVGPADVNNVSMTEGNILITKNIAYYTVQGGIRCNSPDNWVAATEIRTYWVDTQDAQTYRLHFIEETGTQASVSIQVNRKESLNVAGETYEQSRGGSVFEHTRNRIHSTGIGKYEFHLQNLTIKQVNWLKYILQTPMIFWEKEEDLHIPLVVVNGNFNIIDSESPVNELKFSAELSSIKRSQRN